jgi:hypothetical protein
MSHNDWEQGTIVLPSAAAAVLKKTLREKQNAFHNDVRTTAIKFHKHIGTTSRTKYKAALAWNSPLKQSKVGESGYQQMVRRAAIQVLERMLFERKALPPVQPTVAHVSRVAPKATTSTKSYTAIGKDGFEACVFTLDGRTLSYEVFEGNHAVDDAHDSWMYNIVFSFLRKVQWTRGTGGYIKGNNEYNEDEFGHQAGSYLVSTFGPVGMEEQVHKYVRQGFSLKDAKKYAGMR